MRIQIRDAEIEPEECPEEMEFNPIYIDYLKEIKAFCAENNKRIIFVTSPKYFDSCDLDNQKLKDIMDDLVLEYIDDTDFFKEDDNILYWKDIGHMSSIGATKYADRIKEVIENP